MTFLISTPIFKPLVNNVSHKHILLLSLSLSMHTHSLHSSLNGQSQQVLNGKNIYFLWQHRIRISWSSPREHPSQAPALAPGAQLNNWLLARLVGVHAVIKLSLSMRDPLLASQSPVTTDPDTTDPHDLREFLVTIKTSSSSLFLSTSAAGVTIEQLLLSKCLLIGSTHITAYGSCNLTRILWT